MNNLPEEGVGQTTLSDDVNSLLVKSTKAKIVHVLKIMPALTPAALQTSIGTAVPPGLWRPCLEQLIHDGVVAVTNIFTVSPNGRHETRVLWHLASYPYKVLDEDILSNKPQPTEQTAPEEA
jgi:hypothetical protein